MAGAGAKKRAEDNRRKIQGVGAYIAACALLHAAVRLWLRAATATLASWAGFAASGALQAVCFLGIVAVGRPHYDAAGALVDGGGDLGRGAISYYFDVVYVTGAAQALAAFTPWGWLLCLAVPGYAAYQLGVHVVRPWLASAWVDDAAQGDAAGGAGGRRERRVGRGRGRRM